MPLLLQLYTPSDENSSSFFRVVYLFACKNGICHKREPSGAFKCLRSQLEEVNTIWKYEESSMVDVEGTFVPSCALASTCIVCGLAGLKCCGTCKSVYYCSKEHQLLDWTVGHHKTRCCSTAPVVNQPRMEEIEKVRAKVLFPEWEIVTEDEPDKDTLVETTKGLNVKVIEGSDTNRLGDDDIDRNGEEDGKENENEDEGFDDMEETKVDVDKAFLKFQKRMNMEPSQVIR